MRSLQRVTAGPTNLAFGTRTDLNTVIALVAEALGRSVEVDRLPARPGDVRHSQADNTRLRSLFPEIRPTPLTEGLARTIEWMQSFLADRSGVSV